MAEKIMADLDDNRALLQIGGADRHSFLQGLITNDIDAQTDGLRYAALLSPQGKYLADFFVVNDNDHILVDIHKGLAADFAKRLTMYKLRADVSVTATELHVYRGLGDMPDGAFRDPRHDDLGWRFYGTANPGDLANHDWLALHVATQAPLTFVDLIPNESYILEMGFERLNGVDFKKGCYVGQEVTARMKHKTELRKGLARVSVSGSVQPGAVIESNGKPVGTIGTVSGQSALAYVRFDRMGDSATADGTPVTLDT